MPAILFATTLLIYTKNLCPSLWLMDSAEFVFHSTVLGIPHPTGYPLYIQLGKLLTLLPGIDSPLAVNFFSAMMASLTVAMLYLIIQLLEETRLASAAGALLFGFSFTFWSQAEIAEVYTLHTFFLTLITYLLLRSRDTDDRRIVFLLAFAVGLSFTHHMSTVLMLPALFIFLLKYRRKDILSCRRLLPSLLFFATGLSIYIFIPLRAHIPAPFNYPALHGVDPGKLSGLFWLVTGRIVKADMFQYTIGRLDEPITFYLVKLMRDFLYVGFILGLYGALSQFHKDRWVFLTFFAAFLAYFAFFVDYGVVDQYVFFIPSFLFWAIWIGVGSAHLLKRTSGVVPSGMKRRIARCGVEAGLMLLVSLSLLKGLGLNDYSKGRLPDEFARETLEKVGDNGFIASIYEMTPLLWYYHYVKGMRPDVEIFDRGLMSLNVRQEMLQTVDSRSETFEARVGRVYKRQLEDVLLLKARDKTCYLVKYDSFLNDRFFLHEIERGLYRIEVKGIPPFLEGRIPKVAFPGGFRYNERVDLSGVDLDHAELAEGDLFRVRIFWSAVRPLNDNYIAMLRFKRDRELKEYELKENSFLEIYTLGSGLISHENLVPGVVVADEFDGYVPPDTRDGDYRVSLALVEAERFYSIPKDKLSLDYLDLGMVVVHEDPGARHYWE